MTQFVPYLLRTGSVLAVAALLSACSSNNNTTRTTPNDMTMPEPPPGPTADQVARTSMTTLDSSVTALATLSAADDKAGSALKMAKDYSEMITLLGSDGNSMKAMESAQKVLDAHKSLQDALTAAKTAKTAAEEAKGKLPADAEPLLVKALDDAIKKADTQIAATQKILDAEGDPSLAHYVEMVTGTDADNLHTAADVGEGVAKKIADAFVATTARVHISTTASVAMAARSNADIKAANKLFLHDATGHTWAQIVGETKVRKERIGTTAEPNKNRQVASVTGMASSFFASVPTFDDANTADGFMHADANYKGIAGNLVCLGTDCEVDANGKLSGSWYFSPSDEEAYYINRTDDTTTANVDESQLFEPEMFVTYGHWLAETGDNATVNTFAYRGDTDDGFTPEGGSWAAAVQSNPDLRAAKATYSGKAAGRAVHNEIGENGQVTKRHSGRFTADVSLNATFGASPTLGGTVTNFKSPDNSAAVDPNWKVTLKGTTAASNTAATVDASTGELAAAGVAKGSGQDGAWNAQSYGEAGKRPTGIYGGFMAHFTDGHAAGAYATRKAD